MHTVSFIYLFIIYITMWLTLLCVLFDFYWIYIKICGKSVPSRPDRLEIIYKEPGGPYQIGKVLRALFSPRKVCSNGYTKQQKGDEQMAKRSVHYARGPPEWIRTDSLSWIKTKKVNQIWFTRIPRPVWSRCPASHTDTSSKRKPPFGTLPGLCGGASRTT